MRTLRGCLSGIYGAYLAVAALITAFLCWFALRMIGGMLHDHPHPDQIAPLALWCIAHRLWLPLTALPALLCGLVLWKTRRFTIVFLLLGVALLFLPLAAALFCFVMVLAPLYRIQPL